MKYYVGKHLVESDISETSHCFFAIQKIFALFARYILR